MDNVIHFPDRSLTSEAPIVERLAELTMDMLTVERRLDKPNGAIPPDLERELNARALRIRERIRAAIDGSGHDVDRLSCMALNAQAVTNREFAIWAIQYHIDHARYASLEEEHESQGSYWRLMDQLLGLGDHLRV